MNCLFSVFSQLSLCHFLDLCHQSIPPIKKKLSDNEHDKDVEMKTPQIIVVKLLKNKKNLLQVFKRIQIFPNYEDPQPIYLAKDFVEKSLSYF